MQAVILAAGMGTRLGRPHPKSLTVLTNGQTILNQQIKSLQQAYRKKLRLTIVVGFEFKQIMDHAPKASFVYNPKFTKTNTSKSLLRALQNSGPGGVLWMNGDVVFDPAVMAALTNRVKDNKSFIAVDHARVAIEEIKYTVDKRGYIKDLSKTVNPDEALGEAVGINYIDSKNKQNLIKRLKQVGRQDYFERAIELMIAEDGAQWIPVDISEYYAVEVDSPADLHRANREIDGLSRTQEIVDNEEYAVTTAGQSVIAR